MRRHLSVRRERDRRYGAAVAGVGGDLGDGGHVQQSHLAVVTTGQDLLAVGGEGDGVEGAGPVGEAVEFGVVFGGGQAILRMIPARCRLTLPAFLESDDGGFVSLTGHRIGLHHVVRMYAEGASPEAIAAYFPSLPLALIYKVIAFYLENQGEVDSYVADHDAEIARQIAAGPKAPSMVELRLRLEQMRNAGSKAG